MLDVTYAPMLGQRVRLLANEEEGWPEEVAEYLGDGMVQVDPEYRDEDDMDGLREMDFGTPGLWLPTEGAPTARERVSTLMHTGSSGQRAAVAMGWALGGRVGFPDGEGRAAFTQRVYMAVCGFAPLAAVPEVGEALVGMWVVRDGDVGRVEAVLASGDVRVSASDNSRLLWARAELHLLP